MQVQMQNRPLSVGFDLNLTRSLVPLKDMSESHLFALLDDAVMDVACAGQTLFAEGSYDGQHIYLLYGNVSLIDAQGRRTQIKGRESLFPIAHHQPRLVTAVADSDCSFLRINSEQLDKMLTWSQVADYLQLNISRQRDLDEDVDWMMTVLKSNLFFKVPPHSVDQIFSRLTPQVVYAGDVVIRQGEIGEKCYFIKEGDADVVRNTDGKRQHLATISTGRCFGEDALVHQTVRNATVVMRTDGVLMCLEKQDFYKLLKEPYVITQALADLETNMANSVCVDVRSEEEYSQAHLPQAVNVPLNILAIKSRLLSKERNYIFYCDTGRRSRAAASLLAQQGYKAFALTDCPSLFSHAKYEQLLADTHNYMLRDGVAVRGD